jgi:phosphocarrier protein
MNRKLSITESKGGFKRMKSFKYVITDPVGIHARPAQTLVADAKKYASKITIECNGKSAGATSLIKLMSLGIKKDDEITVTVEGDDEEAAAVSFEEFLKANL